MTDILRGRRGQAVGTLAGMWGRCWRDQPGGVGGTLVSGRGAGEEEILKGRQSSAVEVKLGVTIEEVV